MWTCQKCGEQIEDQFDSCWKCATPKAGAGTGAAARKAGEAATPQWRLAYQVFRGTWASWDDLFTQASAFANEVGPERVLSISHSSDHSDGVVTVWYWTTAGANCPL